ncbi:MAG TPA: AAA family ATPase [Pseudomonadota bacterium]|nr:AAA family ATPase [Pseudomonadota bacterium]
MTTLSTSKTTRLPVWADDIRRRYLRGESTQFVLFGNVHDLILDDPDGQIDKRSADERLLPLPEFLSKVLLEKKSMVILYNVSTGVRFVRGKLPAGFEDLALQKEPSKILPLLERLLITQNGVAVVIEYAETVAPAGETSFSTIEDRSSVVTLQRWSMLPALDKNDSLVFMLVENLSELHPKLVANPRVATVQIPIPEAEARQALLRHIRPDMPQDELEMMTEVTAGLKCIQIQGILAPHDVPSDDEAERTKYIAELLGGGAAAMERAQKLAQITKGMPRSEIRRLIAPDGPVTTHADTDARAEVLRLIAARKREIIERECFSLIEFVEPKHGFEVVGGMDEVKKDLSLIAKNIREGRRSRVPMGLLFVGPMGTGKTFVAEAFAKESGLTAIKFKNFRSKWVGATEGNLERILQVVQAIGQVMVIIDEADRAFGNQGEDDGGTSSRVIARIKEFMSDTANRGRVLFVLMTNRPDKIDIDLKRAGRLDRKIPFFYAQTVAEVEPILKAQLRKNKVQSELAFPIAGDALAPIVGMSNADIEAVVLLASDYASQRAETLGTGEVPVSIDDLQRAARDYLPPRDLEMLEFMELLAVFEASNRRMLPPKYADLPIEALQERLQRLKVVAGHRR